MEPTSKSVQWPDIKTHHPQLECWSDSRSPIRMEADTLWLEIQRMEQLYSDGRTHDFELSKTISLRQIDPLALRQLRATGVATFSIPELLFDMDFPGQYMRRLKSVGVSISTTPALCTSTGVIMTLVEHKYRARACSKTLEHYMNPDEGSFVTNSVPISRRAISCGIDGNGLLQLVFQGDHYSTFEGAGAVSTWQLDISGGGEYRSLTDVQLHLRYTSLNGGGGLQKVAKQAVAKAREATEVQGV